MLPERRRDVAARQPTGPKAPAFVERFVKQLNITFKAVKLYPLSSNVPRENARATLELLHEVLRHSPEVRFDVAKDGLWYETLPVHPGQRAFMAFAREFYNRGLAEVRFYGSTTADEVLRFLSLLDVPPVEIARSGGFESRLWDNGVNGIAVREVSTRVVEAEATGGEEEPDEEWPPDAKLIDDVLAEPFGHLPRAQRLLVRLTGDAAALSRYLATPAASRASVPSLAAHRLSALARAVRGNEPSERGRVYARLAEGVGALDPSLLRDVLSRAIAEARHDEGLAAVVRAMTLDRVCLSLICGDLGVRDRAELIRTVRNLVSLGFAPRRETLASVGDALECAGVPEDDRAALLDEVTPSRLRVRERPAPDERPADVVLRLLDAAASSVASAGVETDAGELAREAAAGISDGDIFGALVTIVTLEDRPVEFASMMAMLEDNLGLLIERHDFEVAADAAEAFLLAERREGLTGEQRQRLRRAVNQLAQPERMKIVAGAMRLYRPDTPEREACVRLLTVLGENTVTPLLEVLAEEKDMANRKTLVDMISSMADRFIPELGERVMDGRWFFVRNVVSILGATRDPRTLPYLERTLRHSDARVRRETIRAIAGVKDALAGEMLTSALSDDDGGNVQLAARYLGVLRLRGAVPALQDVARAEGRGNRDAETRVDAIEALGRIGAAESVPVLEQIARQRSLRAGRTRELRAAAERALSMIRAAEGGAA